MKKKNKNKVRQFAPQNSWKAGRGEVLDKYMNKTSYLIKTKNLKLIENLSDCRNNWVRG